MTTTAQRPLLCRKLVTMLKGGPFSVGDKLPGERRLAEMFNTSRNTVREALCNLESMGYLEIRGKSGCYLKSKEGQVNWEMLRTRRNPAARRQLVETLALVAPPLARSQASSLTASHIAKLEDATINLSQAIVKSDLPTIANRYISFYIVLAEIADNDYLQLLLKELALASEKLESQEGGLSEVQKDSLFAFHVELFHTLKNGQPESVEELAERCMQVFAKLALPEG
ncbi:GntR family transcriptional regulator [Pseudodesulfovibrio sp.]|uniref:FadR/GntR family transcriptional regulator n=1 Tax=Pseudodesulfovibrio sp. TaxID=2035812 RepID=UPI002633C5BB|nr:GntR family transcriptional regulator [Pseudodesulfovibrio sp.]MDD3312177.1 GntR family transcriptional regulator [Pseudodesulfovibrio sp.]